MVCFICCHATVQDIMSSAAQPDADKAKKRPVYTTKKKKPTITTQQDTESAAGFELLRCLDFKQCCRYIDITYFNQFHFITVYCGG